METRTALALALLVGAGEALLPSTNKITTSSTAAIVSDDVQNVEDPNTVLDNIYTECVMTFSFPCLQRKAIMFIDRMGKANVFPLVGDFVSLVRTSPAKGPSLSEEKLRYLKSEHLADMVDTAVTDFFQHHVFRLELPPWLDDTPVESRSENSLDFYIGDTEVDEGRKKTSKKGMKKMMMMMCMMMAGKMMMLGPLLMGLTKMAAIKALILSFVSLTISKIMILKKLKMQKGGGGGGSGGWSSGGGGGGWSSGGGGSGGGGWQSSGGGWDRSFSNHDLVYNKHAAAAAAAKS